MHPSTALRLLYFTSFGIYGVSIPFLPIILRQQGLTSSEISWSLTANGIAAILSPLFISHFADRRVQFKLLFGLITAATALLTPCWLLVDSLSSSLIITLLFFLLIVPAFSMLDAYTVRFTINHPLNQDGKKMPFQSYRIWGSIGFTVPTLILLPFYSYQSVSNIFLVTLSTAFALLACLTSLLLPKVAPIKKVLGLPAKEAIRAALVPPLRGVFTATIISGIAVAVFYLYFPGFLTQLGNSTSAIGLIFNLGVFWEILLLPWTGYLVEKFKARGVIMIGIASIAVRFTFVAIFPYTELIVATQILHAPMVMGLFVAIPIYLGQVAGESYRFSLQSLNIILVQGFARILGPAIAATGLSYFELTGLLGYQAVFLFAGGLGVAAFIVLLFSDDSVKSEINLK